MSYGPISTGDQEALKIILEPKYRDGLSDRELQFVEDMRKKLSWTPGQKNWFDAIWERVMA